MGAMKLDLDGMLLYPPESIDRQFADAFGPQPGLFRRIGLCGWWQLIAHPGYPKRINAPKPQQSDVHTLIKASHMPGAPIGNWKNRK